MRAKVTQQQGCEQDQPESKLWWFTRYLKTWFQPNGLGNILSFNEVEIFFVITYSHKEKTFVVHTKGEDCEEWKVHFHNIREGFHSIDLQEYEDTVSMVNTVRKNYE